ncbi:MAG: hypothetical protein KGK12_12500 [Armatimonadetes bacterium]|nr:hypothetical protein [Armatimonadota bacterium]
MNRNTSGSRATQRNAARPTWPFNQLALTLLCVLLFGILHVRSAPSSSVVILAGMRVRRCPGPHQFAPAIIYPFYFGY